MPHISRLQLYIFALVITTSVRVFSFDPLLNDLPSDERDAALLLEEQELDSGVWLQVKSLYQHPLQVPNGDLAVLGDIFPEIGSYLPIRTSVLDRYIPWNDEAIKHFLTDYPIVKHFWPIIQFNYRETDNRGNVSFFLHNEYGEKSSGNFIRSMVQSDVFRTQGSWSLTNEVIRWDRKSITLLPIPRCKIIAGNQTLFFDKGLLYGFFPSDERCTDDKKWNWFCSAASTWNGIGINLSLKDGCTGGHSVDFFTHRRPTETISGGSITVCPTPFLTGTLGITAFEPETASTQQVNIHGLFNFVTANYSAELTFALDRYHLNRIPFTMESMFTCGERKLNLTVIHFPAMFSAPRSALLRKFCEEMDVDDTLSSAVTFVRLTSQELQKDERLLYRWPQMNVWMHGNAIHHGTVIFRGDKQFGEVNVHLEFSRMFGGENLRNNFFGKGKVIWRIANPVTIMTTHIFYHSGYAGNRYRGTFQSSVLTGAGMKIEPAITTIVRGRSLYSVSVGYRQKTTLFKRTFTELYAEKGIRFSDREHFYRVTGNATFQF